jgi:hypothetical protein
LEELTDRKCAGQDASLIEKKRTKFDEIYIDMYLLQIVTPFIPNKKHINLVKNEFSLRLTKFMDKCMKNTNT